MAKEEITPSEWQIMEVLWASDTPLTSSEVYKRMQGNVDMSQRMVRVLMNRLNQKEVLGYTVDERDSRVYRPLSQASAWSVQVFYTARHWLNSHGASSRYVPDC